MWSYRLKPFLCPDGVEDHSVSDKCQQTEDVETDAGGDDEGSGSGRTAVMLIRGRLWIWRQLKQDRNILIIFQKKLFYRKVKLKSAII